MKRIILPAAWFAILVYAAASIVLGPTGIQATRAAQAAARAMKANIELLEGTNRSLNARWGGLRSDPVSIALEGRSLGYLAADEVVIRLPIRAQTEPLNPGRCVFYEVPPTWTEKQARIAGLLSGLIALSALALGRILARRKAA